MDNNKILIIEDEKEQGQYYSKILVKRGFDITGPVCTGRDALDLCKTTKFDLILMDIMLPGNLDGIETVKKINANQQIPVIYITGYDDPKTFNRAMKTDPSGYLVKPVSSSILISTVLTALNKHHLEKILISKEKIYKMLFKGVSSSITILKMISNEKEITDFKIIEGNDSFYKFIKRPVKEIQNKSLFSLFPEIKKLYPEWRTHVTTVIKQKKNFKKLIFFKKGDLWLSVNIVYLDKFHIIAIIDDITENINNEIKISEEAEKFETLFKSSSDAVMILKGKTFFDCNQATLDLFGFKNKSEFLRLNPVDISPPFQKGGNSSQDEANKRLIEALKNGKSHFEWIHRKKDGTDFICDVLLSRFKLNQEECFQATVRDIDKKKKIEEKLRQSEEYLGYTLSSIDSILIVISTKDIVTHWNYRAEKVFGYKRDFVIGKHLSKINLKWQWDKIYEGISNVASMKRTVMLEDISYKRADKKSIILGISINPILNKNDKIIGFLFFGNDITEKRENETLQLQNQKLISIGELAAGIAHEINTPSQYINDNLIFLKESFNFLTQLIDKCRDAVHKKIEFDQDDFDFYIKEIPKAVDQSLEGITHIARIVSSMKTFSHPGNQEKTAVSINKILAATAIISKNEWKYVADLETSFDPANPEVSGYLAELNQVFLNIIVNAAHAIGDAIKQKLISRGKIFLSTFIKDDMAEIVISDNGTGIPEYIQERIYDPFFTTKEIGKGSGQGLAISHQIITKRHNGKIYFKTSEKEGTTFYILFPLYKNI